MKESPNAPPRSIGRYEVLRELGRGSMGIVLLAKDAVLGREVALKYLRSDLELKVEEKGLLMQRMRQEAQALARVTHSGIVALHDIGETEAEGTFLVFEYARGPTLEEAVRRGRLTKEGTARLGREMGEALDAAHGHDIVHRDIKPGNIILTESGSRIADFGVARLPDSTLTRAGARVGTPAYSAPECITQGKHSPASDQFSMAACLYEALSGRRAFPGTEAMEVAKRIQKERPLPIAEALGFSQRVDEVLWRGMSMTPDKRYSSCRELGAALSEALLGIREAQPTLPDESLLLRHDTSDRSRALGFMVLWLLLGATVGIASHRLLSETGAQQDSSETTPIHKAPPLRPAVLTPLPHRKN